MTEEQAPAGDDETVGGAGGGLLAGTAHDGPLDGVQLASRRPRGVLLVDRPAGECWLYDWRDGGFYARSTEPMRLSDDGADNRWRAAEEGEYDVLAAPWVGGAPDDVDVDAAEQADDVDQDEQGGGGADAMPGGEV